MCFCATKGNKKYEMGHSELQCEHSHLGKLFRGTSGVWMYEFLPSLWIWSLRFVVATCDSRAVRWPVKTTQKKTWDWKSHVRKSRADGVSRGFLDQFLALYCIFEAFNILSIFTLLSLSGLWDCQQDSLTPRWVILIFGKCSLLRTWHHVINLTRFYKVQFIL